MRVAEQGTLFEQSVSGAVFSDCNRYRYHLWREVSLAGEGRAVFLMLNPSTADEVTNDPTVARCVRYAKDWGFRHLDVLNIFALRSTDPDALYLAEDPIGPRNDEWIKRVVDDAKLVVCAWGVHGNLNDRGIAVRRMLRHTRKLHALALTKDGHPRHPLYLRAELRPFPLEIV